MIDLLIIAGALLVTALLSAGQLSTDSRDGYGDDHRRAITDDRARAIGD